MTKMPHQEDIQSDSEQEQSEPKAKNEVLESYKEEQEKYKKLKSRLPQKGETRESQTLKMLTNFRKRIQKMKSGEESGEDSWLAHELKCDQVGRVCYNMLVALTKTHPVWALWHVIDAYSTSKTFGRLLSL